mmetsp:Transcript_32426/g.64365  ORF Transcript_32426/g.64365 Transcript_32426/m.64365 type:complete len:216 (-) Transcript_32426:166-813(-)
MKRIRKNFIIDTIEELSLMRCLFFASFPCPFSQPVLSCRRQLKTSSENESEGGGDRSLQSPEELLHLLGGYAGGRGGGFFFPAMATRHESSRERPLAGLVPFHASRLSEPPLPKASQHKGFKRNGRRREMQNSYISSRAPKPSFLPFLPTHPSLLSRRTHAHAHSCSRKISRSQAENRRAIELKKKKPVHSPDTQQTACPSVHLLIPFLSLLSRV